MAVWNAFKTKGIDTRLEAKYFHEQAKASVVEDTPMALSPKPTTVGPNFVLLCDLIHTLYVVPLELGTSSTCTA